MNRFVDEEYHMWKDFEFCITDDDIKKLKQGKMLYSDVDEEYTIILKYYEEEKNKALEQQVPEGHGRLIDADKLRAEYTKPHLVGYDEIIADIDRQPTVVESEGIWSDK